MNTSCKAATRLQSGQPERDIEKGLKRCRFVPLLKAEARHSLPTFGQRKPQSFRVAGDYIDLIGFNGVQTAIIGTNIVYNNVIGPNIVYNNVIRELE